MIWWSGIGDSVSLMMTEDFILYVFVQVAVYSCSVVYHCTWVGCVVT